jgi:hypothetical protein
MKRHLLHPGTVLGIIALIVALSGSVYAATSLPTSSVASAQIKNGSIQLKDLSPAARRALRGARGPAGPAGPAGAAGTAGATGAKGADGTARAFGFVSSQGVLLSARSKNITSARLGQGIYCITPTAASGIDASGVFPVTTPDFVDGPNVGHIAQLSAQSISGCDTAQGWPVQTYTFTGGAWSLSDIAFSVVVP